VRYLILSDIHANREALEAVLADAAGCYDQILCCGDLVGYGADPQAVTSWVQKYVPVVVRGNHDKAVAGADDDALEWFNPAAQAATLWTRSALSRGSLEYLAGLPMGPKAVEDFRLAHGSPLDEDEYLISVAEAGQLFGYLDAQVTLFGHTHMQGGFLLHRHGALRIDPVPIGEQSFEIGITEEHVYLINPGSVGQPRDGDPRAAYAVYRPDERVLVYRRVDYDIRRAQDKILAAGLPEMLALRLAVGK
jgi:predicted phosphodiesterase